MSFEDTHSYSCHLYTDKGNHALTMTTDRRLNAQEVIEAIMKCCPPKSVRKVIIHEQLLPSPTAKELEDDAVEFDKFLLEFRNLTIRA
jgi:hypothetical protein